MGLNLNYEPEVLVEDITAITEETWKNIRKNGIGGSDVAGAFGVSPWKTARDLFLEKTGHECQAQEYDNWVAKEIGKRLEELVVQIFMKKTGFRPYAVRKMFCHPLFPFMLANVDYFVEIDGAIYIVECKTSFSFRMDEWENGAIPRHYELQGRHYMAVTNVQGVIFLCLHGNQEDSFLMRRLERDFDQEEELIEEERYFWEECVLKNEEPDYTEDVTLVLKSIKQHYAIRENSKIELPPSLAEHVTAYLELKQQKAQLDKQVKQVDEKMKEAYAPVLEAMGGAEEGTLAVGTEQYRTGYTKRSTTAINKENMEVMRLLYPDICSQYAQTNISRVFYIKPEKAG